MLVIISQVLLLIAAIVLPLNSRRGLFNKRKNSKNYRIDTDTSNANYAISEFGTLEKINPINRTDEKPEIGN